MNWIISKLRRAVTDESGAVTVDWVVLTAAVVVLAIGAISVLEVQIDALVGDISTKLEYSNVTGG